ncbi:MAG: hypothetical protein FJ202_08085 [Gemmatimonadetes bacterium]|nr:hypothetical protein [Gemmatimonadota bacterium]
MYRASDRELGREVAIKLLTSSSSQEVDRDRFTREIKLTSRLVHPNIVPLFDSGVVGDRLFYVMPLIAGPTLRQRLKSEGIVGADEVIAIAVDLCEALAYAHGHGVVHRDLKPENVFSHHGRALLSDFGIATLAASDERRSSGAVRISETGEMSVASEAVVGTVAYMSPKQFTSPTTVDHRSDLYSLGCLLYECLTGDPPYRGGNATAVITQHLVEPIPRVRDRAPTTPSRLAQLIERLLAKDPAQRPGSAAEVVEALHAPAGVSAPISSPTPIAAPPALHDPRFNASSMDACREGRVLFQRSYQGGTGAKEKLDYAKALFERGRDLDPTNPHALVGLADVHLVLGFRGFADFRESSRLATEFRTQALRLDPALGQVRISIAVDLLYWKDDFETAGAEFRRGIQDPNVGPEGHRLYGAYLKIAGRVEEALEEMRIGLAGDPSAPSLQVGYADVLMAMGRYVEALDHLRTALRLSPGYESALERLDLSLARLGRYDEAMDARRALHGFRGQQERNAAIDQDMASLPAEQAREADVRRDLRALLERANAGDPFIDLNVSRQLADYIILAYTELGEWDKAMDWIEKGFYRRPGRLRRVLTDLPFDRHGLASDPRYARMLRTAGLEELL